MFFLNLCIFEYKIWNKHVCLLFPIVINFVKLLILFSHFFTFFRVTNVQEVLNLVERARRVQQDQIALRYITISQEINILYKGITRKIKEFL